MDNNRPSPLEITQTVPSPTSSSSINSIPIEQQQAQTLYTKLSTCHIKTLSESPFLPKAISLIVENPKGSLLGVLLTYLVFLLFWVPSYMCSFVVGEMGVYLFIICFIYYIGKFILTALCFPGGGLVSSTKIIMDIEQSFGKYSIKVLEHACSGIKECSIALLKSQYSSQEQMQELHHYVGSTLNSYHVVLGILLKRESNSSFGDVGDLSAISEEAKEDGRFLFLKLKKICICVKELSSSTKKEALLHEIIAHVNELREKLMTIAYTCKLLSQEEVGEVELEENSNDLLQSQQQSLYNQEKKETVFSSIRKSANDISLLLNPRKRSNIFGLDVLRGILLQKYPGSKQIWISRSHYGQIDAIHIPCYQSKQNRVVLYCNPNAGMYEVATGFSDVKKQHQENWTDFYLNKGFDVVLFNYACYGRSFSRGIFWNSSKIPYSSENSMKQIFQNLFLRVQPSPASLKYDSLIVAKYLLNTMKYPKIIVHGESIGGMAASSVAFHFSNTLYKNQKDSLTTSLLNNTYKHPIALLIADRTFCNLESTASYLIGSWTNTAISCLTPFWNTNVAYDYLHSSCSKILCNDANDTIIIDPASLKSGLGYACEFQNFKQSNVGYFLNLTIPMQYRLADYLLDLKDLSKSSLKNPAPPIWPADKKLSIKEAFHFAACVRRIGKLATLTKKSTAQDQLSKQLAMHNSLALAAMMQYNNNQNNTEEEQLDDEAMLLIQSWMLLSSVDGLCGSSLGQATKIGFFATLSWLVNCLIFGPQVIQAYTRNHTQQNTEEDLFPSTCDYSISFPQVLMKLNDLKNIISKSNISHELYYISSVFEYIYQRITSNLVLSSINHPLLPNESKIGKFLNLHCGHNHLFSLAEKEELSACLNYVKSLNIHEEERDSDVDGNITIEAGFVDDLVEDRLDDIIEN